MVSFAVLLAMLALGPAGLSGAGGQEVVLRVTTDTPEYCFHLMERLQDAVHAQGRPAPADVSDLSDEGEQMCERGETRRGILRLRRALRIILSPSGP
jgi:hypothetical protein